MKSARPINFLAANNNVWPWPERSFVNPRKATREIGTLELIVNVRTSALAPCVAPAGQKGRSYD